MTKGKSERETNERKRLEKNRKGQKRLGGKGISSGFMKKKKLFSMEEKNPDAPC